MFLQTPGRQDLLALNPEGTGGYPGGCAPEITRERGLAGVQGGISHWGAGGAGLPAPAPLALHRRGACVMEIAGSPRLKKRIIRDGSDACFVDLDSVEVFTLRGEERSGATSLGAEEVAECRLKDHRLKARLERILERQHTSRSER